VHAAPPVPATVSRIVGLYHPRARGQGKTGVAPPVSHRYFTGLNVHCSRWHSILPVPAKGLSHAVGKLAHRRGNDRMYRGSRPGHAAVVADAVRAPWRADGSTADR